MEGMSPGAEFYTNLELMIESRKRYLDFIEAHTKREVETQQMLTDCFAKHEKMISWLWNHVSDLQLDISSLQEECHSSSSAGRSIPTSPPPESTRQLHIPEPSMIPETPPEQLPPSKLQIPSPAQKEISEEEHNAEPDRVLVMETPSERPHSPKRIPEPFPKHPSDPSLAYDPDQENSSHPGISFSQRLLERKKEGAFDDDAAAAKKNASNNSESSVLSNAVTQPPHVSAPGNGASTPGATSLMNEHPTDAAFLSGENHSKIPPGSAVTPFKTVQRTGLSSRPGKGLQLTPNEEPSVVPEMGTENESISTGRLKKKRKKRKRPRLQLEELEPEPEQTMDEIQEESGGEATEGDRRARKNRLSFVTPKAPRNEEAEVETDQKDKCPGFTIQEKSSKRDPQSATLGQRKRLTFLTERVMPGGSTVPATTRKELTGRNEAHSNKPSSKTLRIDGFKTPEAADRAARAIQSNFRRKEDCAAIETVLGNARKGLTGYSCHLCEGFMRAAAASHSDPEAEYQRLVDGGCKHRAKKPPPATPPNYWKLTFDETQTQPPNGPPA